MRDHTHGRAAEPDPEVWTGHAKNRMQWLLATGGAACLALGIKLAIDMPWTTGGVPLMMAVVGCLAAGLLMLFGTVAFVRVAVRIDHGAVEVRCGHMGLPRRHIPLDDIADVAFQSRVTPCHWGGWGYRWRPEKGTAVVVRRGEGLVLQLHDGRSFTVTVDEAQAAVRAIRGRLRLPDSSGGSQAQVQGPA